MMEIQKRAIAAAITQQQGKADLGMQESILLRQPQTDVSDPTLHLLPGATSASVAGVIQNMEPGLLSSLLKKLPSDRAGRWQIRVNAMTCWLQQEYTDCKPPDRAHQRYLELVTRVGKLVPESGGTTGQTASLSPLPDELIQSLEKRADELEEVGKKIARTSESITKMVKDNPVDFSRINRLSEQGVELAATQKQLSGLLLSEWNQLQQRIQGAGLRTIDTYIAGLMKDGREQQAATLMIGEPLQLRPQADNPHDSNAVEVVRCDGGTIGFLNRKLASALSPWLVVNPTSALVVSILWNPSSEQYRVQIQFQIPGDVYAGEERNLVYSVESSSKAQYLLLDGDNVLFDQIVGTLKEHGLDPVDSGPSFRGSNQGRIHDWYIKLEPGAIDDQALVDLVYRHYSHRLSHESVAVEELSRKNCDTEQDFLDAIRMNDELKQEHEKQVIELIRDIDRYKSEMESGMKQLSACNRQWLEYAISNWSGSMTPENVLGLIGRIWGERVVVLPSAVQSARASANFRYSHRLLQLLIDFSTHYHERLCNGDDERSAAECLGEACALKESESVINSKKGRKQRTFEWAGESLLMERHLRIGNRMDPAETLRLHYHWDSARQKLVIGHCGAHLYTPGHK